MKLFVRTAGVLLALVFASSLTYAQAKVQDKDSVPVVTSAWVKPSIPGSTVSAAYFSVQSARAFKLVKVETPVANIAELHNMTMVDGVMKMKGEDAFEVTAGKPLELKPGGRHIMLIKLKRPIQAGDKVPLSLTFEGTDRKAMVVKLDATAQEIPGRH